MNPFAALESDDEDESFTKVQSSKKTGEYYVFHLHDAVKMQLTVFSF